MLRNAPRVVALFILAWAAISVALAQAPLGTAFTLQGRLTDGGVPADSAYDLRFALYDQMTGGVPQGAAVCVDDVAVAEGLFAVTSSTLVANFNTDRIDGFDSAAFLQAVRDPLTLNGASGGHIIGGVPGGKVCRRVEAVRNDRQARAHDSRVEVAKTGQARGKYQHPELYGQPAEMRVDCDAAQEHGSREHSSASEVRDGARE